MGNQKTMHLKRNSPMQGTVLHDRESVFNPMQYCPPFFGAGLLHSRDLCLVPPPQVTEHGPYVLQADHKPLTTINWPIIHKTC